MFKFFFQKQINHLWIESNAHVFSHSSFVKVVMINIDCHFCLKVERRRPIKVTVIICRKTSSRYSSFICYAIVIIHLHKYSRGSAIIQYITCVNLHLFKCTFTFVYQLYVYIEWSTLIKQKLYLQNLEKN